MKKLIRLLFITLLIIFAIEFSDFLYKSGYTDKALGYLKKTYASILNLPINTNDYPVIKSISNSSGGKLINDDVVILIEAIDKEGIANFYYSFNKKDWYSDFNYIKINKKAEAKLVFNSTMDKTVYFYVTNNKLNKSYIFSTKVLIDKDKPKLTYEVSYDNNIKRIYATAIDNYEMKKMQYSYDSKIWYDDYEYKYYSLNKKLDGKLVKSINQKIYIRAVDKVGNISKVYSIN
ncbi:MAG TPA: hypothetical protein PKY25_01840 [Bacilli bacterium]|nr:hypothetical protein [Bacilli bacterium]